MASSGVRLSLIVVNVIFLLAGLTVLGLGIWVQVEKGDYIAIADSDTGLTGSLLIIIVGAVATIISFIGFLGAVKRSVAFLWIFFAVLVVILIVEIVALILGLVYRQKVEDELQKDLHKTLQEYGTDVVGVTKSWDWAQRKFMCCGVDSYTNWRTAINAFNKEGLYTVVPDSCCIDEKKGCGNFTAPGVTNDVDQSKIHTKGCYPELRDFIKEHLLTIGISALAVFLLQIIVLILTFVMIRGVKSESKVV